MFLDGFSFHSSFFSNCITVLFSISLSSRMLTSLLPYPIFSIVMYGSYNCSTVLSLPARRQAAIVKMYHKPYLEEIWYPAVAIMTQIQSKSADDAAYAAYRLQPTLLLIYKLWKYQSILYPFVLSVFCRTQLALCPINLFRSLWYQMRLKNNFKNLEMKPSL